MCSTLASHQRAFLGWVGVRQLMRCVSSVSTEWPKIPKWLPMDCDSNNKCLPSAPSQSRFTVENPATGETLAHISDYTSSDAVAAVERAVSAQREWAHSSTEKRTKALMQWHDLIMKHKEELASLIVLEMGKPLAQARGEIDYGTSFLKFYCEQAKRLHGEIIPDPRSNQRKLLLQWEPLGVAGLITPWNFPNAMIMRKASPALAAGCSVVLKPSEDTPLSALALAELWSKVDDLPAGVFNVVPCSRDRAAEVGSVLCSHDAVGAVSVTGSTCTGQIVMKASADSLKRLSLELGGNAPLIVFPSADMEMAVSGCMLTKFRNSGQTCVCANRIYVHESVHDEFVAKLGEKIHQLKVGHGFTEAVDIGPLINERGVRKVESLVEASVAAGAKVLHGGKRSAAGSCFYEPTLLTGVTSDMPCAKEEIFGPVASIIKFGEGMSLRESEETVLGLANDCKSGLAAYFFSEDYRQIWRVSQRLEYGIVGANEGAVTMDVAPSSGRKQSGLGAEGSHHGFADYVEIKYICMGGNFDMRAPQ